MHDRGAMLRAVVEQWTGAQPVNQVFGIGRIENFLDRVAGLEQITAPCHGNGNQMQIVIAQNTDGRAAQTTDGA